MSATTGEARPLVMFPHHLGPCVRHLTPALFYAGTLVVSMPGWLLPDVLLSFSSVEDRARERGGVLATLVGVVVHLLELVQTQALAEAKNLGPLGPRIQRTMIVYPGTTSVYSEWDAHRDCALPVATRLLGDPQLANVAATEFIWRVYELSLEVSEDPDAILDYLAQRADELGGPTALLAECLLNRLTPVVNFERNDHDLVTSTPEAMTLMSLFSEEIVSDGADLVRARAGVLAFELFCDLLEPYAPPLYGPDLESVARVMDQHEEELSRMRDKCRVEALKLAHAPPSEPMLRDVIESVLASMKDEVAEIAHLDRGAFSSLIKGIVESDSTIAAIAALVGSAVATQPAVTASLAVTAFSVLGANALKASRERREALRRSPWSFVYFLRQRS